MTPDRRRFPLGLTVAAVIAFAILCGLGSWQLKRLAWKRDLLARIEALKTAPAVPLPVALARAERGEAVEWTRVDAECAAPRPDDQQALLYGVRGGEIVWRALAACRLPQGPVIGVDRGLVDAYTGALSPDRVQFAPPVQVRGILRAFEPSRAAAPASPEQKIKGGFRGDDRHWFTFGFLARSDRARPPTIAGPGAVYLSAESETPAPAGITPAPLPGEISNRHLEYALTWFGLAGALACVYAAVLWRDARS